MLSHHTLSFKNGDGVINALDRAAMKAAQGTGPYPVQYISVEQLKEKGLDVKIIVGAHSPRIASIDDLRKALALSPVQVAQNKH